MLALRQRRQAALSDTAVTSDACSVESCLNQEESIRSENASHECGLPKAPEAREKVKEHVPESFDELAVHLDKKFARLAADAEQMVKELRQAEERSEQLRHRLLEGRHF
jgi:hypothetical protein